MFAGDEVSAVVIDVGHSTTKAGFAGSDTPTAVFPSVAGVQLKSSGVVGQGARPLGQSDGGKVHHVGTTAISYRRDAMEIVSPLEDGLVRDWDVVEKLWSHAFEERLGIKTEEHPVLMAEPSWNTRKHRERMVELMFEKYQVPAFFLARNAVLASFACGRSTSLVFDSGGGMTSAVPVYDGFVLQNGIVKSQVAGDLLTKELFSLLQQKKVEFLPRYMLKKREVTAGKFEVTILDFPQTASSYKEYMTLEVVRDMKETVSKVSEKPFVAANNAHIPTVSYELPDGKVAEVGTERFHVPEIMFQPSLLQKPVANAVGAHQMIHSAISNCDSDMRRELYKGVVCTGANTLLDGFTDRLNSELQQLSPTQKFKILAPHNTAERRFGVWIGGSILASVGTFHQLWMSRSEYDEHGATLCIEKCP